MNKYKSKIFLDANIFIAGSASSKGGSAFILNACKNGVFQVTTSKLILQEAEKNIVAKFDKLVLNKFYNWIKTISLQIQPAVLIGYNYQNIIEAKDAHVLAAAIESKSDYLVTLDRKHFFTDKINQANLLIKIVTPKEFINNQSR